MAWNLLPVNYTDAAWVGLKRYNQIDNEDGTISLQDVTVYSNKEKSFFGAKDANRMNEALNTLMSMVENGTDLYAAFQNYFKEQKDLFEAAANVSQEDFNAYIESLKADADTTIEGIKTDYAEDMQDFQNQQEELFQLWFDYVKGQLGQDVAGNLLNEIIAVKETSDAAKAITDTKGQANGLATLDDTGKLVQMPTADDVGAIATSKLGVSNGVATLDENGKLKQMPTPADIGAVNKAGDTMTGTLKITQDNIGISRFWGNKFGAYIATDPIGTPQYQLCLNRKADTTLPSNLKTALYLAVSNDGNIWNEVHNVLHTGNKPNGSYTGNGSTTSRTIDTGGFGNVIAIWSETGVVLVTPAGGFYGYSGSSFSHFPSETAKFYDGTLVIASKHTTLNTNGQTYYYQVL